MSSHRLSNKILITGGAGFIGIFVILRFLSEGYSVNVFDNYSIGSREKLVDFGCSINVIEGDASDFDLALRITQGIDSIIHLAAIPSVIVSTNTPWLNQKSGEVSGLAILHAAALKKVRRVVLASTAAVYGNPQSCPISETAPLAPIRNYGVSKAALEMYGCATSHNHPETDVVALRFFNVYGPGQNPDSAYSGVLSIFCRQARANQPVTIYGTGEQTRDFVIVDDVAHACFLAATSKKRFEGAAITIGTGQATSLNQLWASLMISCNTCMEPDFQPNRDGEIIHSCANVELAMQLLGFSAQTPLIRGTCSTFMTTS